MYKLLLYMLVIVGVCLSVAYASENNKDIKSIVLDPLYYSESNVNVSLLEFSAVSRGRVTVVRGSVAVDGVPLSQGGYTVQTICERRSQNLTKEREVMSDQFNVYYIQLFTSQRCLSGNQIWVSIQLADQVYWGGPFDVGFESIAKDSSSTRSSSSGQTIASGGGSSDGAHGVPEFSVFTALLAIVLSCAGLFGMRRYMH